jgi:hypothetical protein
MGLPFAPIFWRRLHDASKTKQFPSDYSTFLLKYLNKKSCSTPPTQLRGSGPREAQHDSVQTEDGAASIIYLHAALWNSVEFVARPDRSQRLAGSRFGVCDHISESQRFGRWISANLEYAI